MTDDVIPSRRIRNLGWISGIVVCFLIAGAGVAAAAIRFDERNRDIVLKGLSVGGVDVGGMPVDKAKATLLDRFDDPLDHPISVKVAGQYFTTSPRQLGAKTNALQVLEEARSMRGTMPVAQRVWFGISGKSLDRDMRTRVTFDTDKIESFVSGVESSVNVSPADASLSLVDGSLKISDDKLGFELDHKQSVKSIEAALSKGETTVALEGKQRPAALRKSLLNDVIVVKIGENKLFHYQGENLVKVYDVATGSAEFPTPKGLFKIVSKRFKPTWVNPAKFPGGWGYNLPASIPSGPGNPLGTRAMDLNSTGIRIHGTYAANSMGYNASHGCIRMRIADSEELFGLIPVGTPVLIVQTAPLRPLPARLRPTTPEPMAEGDGTKVPGQAQPSPTPATSPTPTPSPTPLSPVH